MGRAWSIQALQKSRKRFFACVRSAGAMITVAVPFYYMPNWVLFNNILTWIRSLLIRNNAIMNTWQMLTEKRLSAKIDSLTKLLPVSLWPQTISRLWEDGDGVCPSAVPGLTGPNGGISWVFSAVFLWVVLCIQLAGQVTGERAVCGAVGCFMPRFLQIQNLIISLIFYFFSCLKKKQQNWFD